MTAIGWMSVRRRQRHDRLGSSATSASTVACGALIEDHHLGLARRARAPPAAQASTSSLSGSRRLIVMKRVRSPSAANSAWERTIGDTRGDFRRRQRIERVDAGSVPL